MTSFLSRLKSNTGPTSPPTVTPNPKDKKAPAPIPPSALELLLANAGPLRDDGSDKFFGMHNPSNTCYCNSVLQCLYFSEPFREQVITFPHGAKERSTVARPKMDTRMTNGNGALSSITAGKVVSSFQPTSPTGSKPAPPPILPNSKPEENKESFDFQKKQAMLVGPHIKMEDANYEAYGMPESLFTSLKDIFEALIVNPSRTGIVTPAKFLEVLRRNFELFRSPMHQDAHEFLNLLLNDVVEQVESFSKKATEQTATKGLNWKPNTSWVHELFEGTLTSETRCLTCETTSQRDEVFLDLSVDLEEHSSVTSCLARFSQEEMLCERNKFHCDRCGGLQEAEKRMKIKRLPRILALHLKRFKYTEDYGRLQKLFHRVVYPFHLRLLNTTDDVEDPDLLYELYAVIVHLGSTPFHGHYVSIVKTQDRGWLLFDDELVIPVDRNYVRNYFGGGEQRNPACAYVLFYQETTEEAMQREQDIEDPQGETVPGVASQDFTAGRASTSVPLSPPMSAADLSQSSINEEADPFADPVDVKLPAAAPLRAAQVPVIANPLEARYSKAPEQSPTVGMTPQASTDQSSRPVSRPTNNPRPLSRYQSSAIIDEEAGAVESSSQPTKSTTSFGRFRPGSMSIRSKSKFWSSGKDKDESPSSPAPVVEEAQAAPGSSEKDKVKSGRFSLSRKRTSFIGGSK